MKEPSIGRKVYGQRPVIASSQPGTQPLEDDDLAQRYRAWRKSTLGAVTERLEVTAVLEVMGWLKGKRVLDAGCRNEKR